MNLLPSFFRPKRQPDLRPPAAAPGTLVHVGERRVEQVSFRVIDYTANEVRELNATRADECVDFEGKDSPTWIMVTGLHDTKEIGALLTAYDIHPLIQEDVLNTQHQPKVEDFGDYIYIASKLISRRPDGGGCDIQHLSIILTSRAVISFHEEPTKLFDPVIQRLREGKGRLRSAGPDYLTWALLDAVLDNYLIVLSHLEDEVNTMDERLSGGSSDGVTMAEIHALRVQMNYLYRTLRPMREVAISLQRIETDLISRSLNPFLRDLYDHAWHAIEIADHLRESVTAMREFYQAKLAHRLNEVMKVLTGISTIFLPLSFLAGVYGMNFEVGMSELRHPYGYRIIWGVFLLLGFGMFWYFRRRRWL